MIAVVGGGPAGATIARALAARSRAVTLITPAAPATRRLELISPRTLRAFEAAGLADLLRRTGLAAPCSGIEHIDHDGRTGFQGFGAPGKAGAYIVDRGKLDPALLALAGQAGAIIRTGRVRRCTAAPGAFALDATGPSGPFRVAAAQVIDATGRAAAIARRLGARRVEGDIRLAQRLDAGPAGAGDAMRVAWDGSGWTTSMTGPSGRERWRVGSADHMPRSGSDICDASPRLSEPAAGEGWAAIGDAAAAFDPVNSQGLDHALTSAAVAAGVILSHGRFDRESGRIYNAANQLTALSADRARASLYASAAI